MDPPRASVQVTYLKGDSRKLKREKGTNKLEQRETVIKLVLSSWFYLWETEVTLVSPMAQW